MSGKVQRSVTTDDPTIFRVALDDESTAQLLEQAEAARCPPLLLLSVIIRDVLAHAKETGLTFAVAMPPAGNARKH